MADGRTGCVRVLALLSKTTLAGVAEVAAQLLKKKRRLAMATSAQKKNSTRAVQWLCKERYTAVKKGRSLQCFKKKGAT